MRCPGALAVGLTLALATPMTPATAVTSATTPVTHAAPSVRAAGQAKPAGELDALTRKLKSTEERERREAVQELAKLATPPAWSLVLDALKDPHPMVADEAQLALGALDDAGVLKELLGKKGLQSGDEWVGLRAAEVLGRVTIPVDSGALGRELADKDPRVRRTMAWSIERLARAKLVDDKARKYLDTALEGVTKKDKDPGTRAAALLALEAVALRPKHDTIEKSTEVVLEGLDDDSPEVLCATMKIMHERFGNVVLDSLVMFRHSPHLAVRRELVDILASLDTREAALLLAVLLQDEKNLRLSWTIVEHLQDLSGLENQLNPPFWKEWAAKINADKEWKPRTAPKEPPKRDYGPATTVFAGQPVLSSRVAILVDFSGSLWETGPSGKTRKELVDVEVRRTLESFTPDTHFNLIPYTDKPIPWQKALVPATPANVKKALAFFEGCKERGKGNFWDAAMHALEDPEVDTLLMLGDGAPTGGHRWNLQLMAPLFAEHNRFRHVVLDAVIVDAKPFIQDCWKTLCGQSGGRMLPIELR